MSGFSKREESFEKLFAFDAEKRFKAEARRNKLLAQWMGEKAKLTPEQVAAYATELIQHDLKTRGDEDVAMKLMDDLKTHGVNATTADIRAEMSRCFRLAAEQIAGDG